MRISNSSSSRRIEKKMSKLTREKPREKREKLRDVTFRR